MTYKNEINCLKASAVAVLLLFFQPLLGQKNFSVLAEALPTKASLLGSDFAVVVGGADSIFYQKEMGSMKVKTVAPIAGASEWLTAALILQLVDEGKLSLNDKVARYLPVFQKYGKSYITIRHCLSHLTGIDDEEGTVRNLLERKKYNSLEEEVAALAAHEIDTNPGEAFSYGGIGITIAGRVAEVAGKKRFDLLIKQKLLTPLGMRQTTFTTLDGRAPSPATGLRHRTIWRF